MLPRFEKFIYDITEIDQYWHRISADVMQQYGLKGSCSIYFVKLHGNPQGLTAAQLGPLCSKDKADVSRDMNVLEKAGYVQRIRSGGSAYRAKILLTPSGMALTEQIIRTAEEAVNLVGHELSDQDRAVFYRVLDIITHNLQALSETGLP